MKKTRKIVSICGVFVLTLLFSMGVSAKTVQHTVVKGDSMWKIAVRYQVGLSEMIAANPQISNPALIYPGQVLTIPLTDEGVTIFEQRVVDLTNQKRAQSGLKPLTVNWELSRVARYKSQDMLDNRYFSHNSPKYGTPFEMMKSFGITYRGAAENIAKGQTSPEAVVNSWWNSPGHRKNMLGNYNQIGVGYVKNGNYWTQMFILK